MEKRNRFLSFELLLALLFIVAFFLPWLDWGVLKVSGWDIPELQKKMTKVTNFFKFFSKNKEWIYSTHVVYIIPLLSLLSISFWLMLKRRFARILLMVTGVLGVVVAFNLFYKLPKAGTGVYLLTAASVVTVVYLIIVSLRKKKEPELLHTPPDEADVMDEIEEGN